MPPDYTKVQRLMEKHIKNLNMKTEKEHLLICASDLHAEFEAIHPFKDGNGRRGAGYIAAMQKSNKGDLNTLRAFILSIIYEEMESLKRLVESLVR